jgi:molybdopterin/thiamine biosynthesis adenylyltransferase
MSTLRYKRISDSAFVGPEGLTRLQSKTVVILGVGNIGNQVASHLAMLGINLILVDRGTVREENLGTQAYRAKEIGKPKVQMLARRLKAMNTDSAIAPVYADFGKLGMAAFRDVDVIVCCLDNIADRTRVNELAYRFKRPWIDGAIDGSGRLLHARISVFDPQMEETSCYLCQWDSKSFQSAIDLERKIAHKDRASRGCPDWRWLMKQGGTAPPTLSISSLGGVAAGLLSIFAIQLLLGRMEKALAGAEIRLDLTQKPFSMKEFRLVRNPSCLFDHREFRDLVVIEENLKKVAIRQIFSRAEKALGEGVVLLLHGRELITKMICPICKMEKEIYKITESIKEVETRCPHGHEMRSSGHYTLSSLSKEQAKPILNRSYAAIGMPDQDVITAISKGKEVNYLITKPMMREWKVNQHG